MSLERDYMQAALEAAVLYAHLLPPDAKRKVLLAQSVFNSFGCATGEELRTELGKTWVIARRTKNIVAKYGKDVKCVTSKQYAAAERRAIEKRIQLV